MTEKEYIESRQPGEWGKINDGYIEPEPFAPEAFVAASGYAATETVECNIVGADASDRTLIVQVPSGVRGTMIGDGATITLKRHNTIKIRNRL